MSSILRKLAANALRQALVSNLNERRAHIENARKIHDPAEENENRVTIFSNGVADFQRVFSTTGEKQQVELHVKKDHVGDILSSLIIDGPVVLTVPPNFTPENEQYGDKLTLSEDNVFQDIFRQLRGSQIKITTIGSEVLEGRIFGLDSEIVAIHGDAEHSATKNYYGQILTETGLRRVLQSAVTTMEFPQDSVKSEVDKALNRAFQKIRPQSTTVDMEVTSESPDQQFTIQYTVPAAAWKMTYRLIHTGSDDYNIRLDGVGVVDNNTEEDWDDFLVSMVVGEPVTFSTDVATSKIPRRQNINLVSQAAQGGVEIEKGRVAEKARRVHRHMGAERKAAAFDMMEATAEAERFGGGSMAMMSAAAPPPMEEAQNAMVPDASSREVGDFAVWDVENPLTIKAGQSAEIPVFSTELKDADAVLFYKFANNPERAFRSIRFKNKTGNNLGRGVCTVYEKGVYSGSAILSAAQKDEDVLLCHAVETGVRVSFTPGNQEHEVSSLHIAKGIVVQTNNWRRESTYTIKNMKDEEFLLVLDHQKVWDRKGVLTSLLEEEKIEPKEELKNGVRFEVPVPPGASIVLSVMETFGQEQRLTLGKAWLDRTIIATEHPLLAENSIQSVIELEKKLVQLQGVETHLRRKLETIESEQQRVRSLIESDPNNDQWKDDLRSTETEIRSLSRKELPKIAKDITEAREAVHAALQTVAVQWTKEGSCGVTRD